MSSSSKHLRLVDPHIVALDTNFGSGRQLPLFPHMECGVLGLFDVSKALDASFLKVLAEFRPRHVLDVRPVPNFNIGRLTRGAVFSLFEENSVDYQDISSSVSPRKLRDLQNHALEVSEEICAVVSRRASKHAEDALLLLVSHYSHANLLAQILPPQLLPKPKNGWSVCNL